MSQDQTGFTGRRTDSSQEVPPAAALAQARDAALRSGKEPFDLPGLEAAWRDNPDAYHAARGVVMPREWCLREWEQLYYCQFPAIRSNREFIARMKDLQAQGFFD